MRAWHYLALQLGGTVAELQARMSYREWLHWCAYFAIEPAATLEQALLAPAPPPASPASGNQLLQKFRAIVGEHA